MPFIPAEALSVSAFQSDVKGVVNDTRRERFDARNLQVPSAIDPAAIVLMDRCLPSSDPGGRDPHLRGAGIVSW